MCLTMRALMSELERTRVLCDEDFLCVGEGLDKVLCELERTRLVTSGCYSLGILVTVRIWLKPLRCFVSFLRLDCACDCAQM